MLQKPNNQIRSGKTRIENTDYVFRDEIKSTDGMDTSFIEMKSGPFCGAIFQFGQVDLKKIQQGVVGFKIYLNQEYTPEDIIKKINQDIDYFYAETGDVLMSILVEDINEYDARTNNPAWVVNK